LFRIPHKGNRIKQTENGLKEKVNLILYLQIFLVLYYYYYYYHHHHHHHRRRRRRRHHHHHHHHHHHYHFYAVYLQLYT